jgi:hypothetical protein
MPFSWGASLALFCYVSIHSCKYNTKAQDRHYTNFNQHHRHNFFIAFLPGLSLLFLDQSYSELFFGYNAEILTLCAVWLAENQVWC